MREHLHIAKIPRASSDDDGSSPQCACNVLQGSLTQDERSFFERERERLIWDIATVRCMETL